MMQAVPIADDPSVLGPIFQTLKANSVRSLPRLSVAFRKVQLQQLHRGMSQMQGQFTAALRADLGQSPFFNFLTSTNTVKTQIQHMLKNIDDFSAPRTVDTPMFVSGNSHIQPEPFGLALIMGAWNYPSTTSLVPAVNAIAAGNSVLLKPSQMSPCCSNTIRRLFQKYMDSRFYRVVEGQINICKAIIQLPFDLIIFTGSPQKGRLVAEAAGRNLIPCILELGGKSPVIVDEDADIQNAALRVTFGRYINCGQTCVAPDYVLVHSKVKTQFVSAMVEKIKQFYGEEPVKSDDLGRIVNQFHVKRVMGYLAEDHHGEVVIGGKCYQKQKFIQPTLVINPSLDSSLMKEQIFGPVLPVREIQSVEKAIDFINAREKPLALYYFGNRNCRKVELETSSGALVHNDTVMYMMNLDLPFGGVGNSGYGCMHGKTGFDNCSHLKAFMEVRTFNFGPFLLRYPPFGETKCNRFKTVMNLLNVGQRSFIRKVLIFIALLAIAYLASVLIS